MANTTIRFTSFPQTEPPPDFASSVAGIFARYEKQIGTEYLRKGLTSNDVLAVLREDLVELGFEVEAGRNKTR